MSFSSPVFLFLFLPIAIILAYIVRDEMRNIMLVVISIVFYWYGQRNFVLPLLCSIIFNYITGLVIEQNKSKKIIRRVIFILGVAGNVVLLYVFKYLNFSIETINVLCDKSIRAIDLVLPIGLSFFTFKAISYLADIYMGKSIAEKKLFDFALYISFFPQIMSGPITRYCDFRTDLVRRKFKIEEISFGIERLICGLGKKIIMSNTFAIVADRAFNSMGDNELTVVLSWLGSICYTLQIYFDFSGYSDMAIGIGELFGFYCKENFNYPYISKSGTEFWRRWHISLGSWFRDYVYFPLGGSRVNKKTRLFMNLAVVWILTGIWHGANWTFIVWGIYWLIVQVFEKFILFPEKLQHISSRVIYRIYILLCINFGWVIFRAPNLSVAWSYIKSMLGMNHIPVMNEFDLFLLKDNLILLTVGIILSTPIMKYMCDKKKNVTVFKIVKVSALLCMFLVCVAYSINVSYNPFIYFDF